MRRLVLVMMVLLALAGCGDDGGSDEPKTFDNEDFAITFEYPGDFEEFDEVEFSQSLGGEATAQAGVGLDKRNVIAVTRYELGVTVKPENLPEVKTELDKLIQGAAPDAQAKQVEAGGLPGFEYTVSVPDIPGAEARLVFLFDGKDEYLINCQGKDDNADELAAGCRTALRTLKTR